MLFGKTENLERYDKTAFLLYLIAFGADIDDDREVLYNLFHFHTILNQS